MTVYRFVARQLGLGPEHSLEVTVDMQGLKAELTALYDQAITTGEMPTGECLKLIDLWSNKAEVIALNNEDPAFKAKGRMVAGLLQLMLVEAQRLEELKKDFVERLQKTDGPAN